MFLFNFAYEVLIAIKTLLFTIEPLWIVYEHAISSTDNHFTQQEMSQMLGVSKRTIENRMAEYELTNKSRYTDIGDDFLDSLVQRAMSNFPRSGKGCSFVSFVYYG